MSSEATNNLKVLRTFCIEVPSDLKELDRLLFQFNQIYQDFIPDRDWLQCRLALAEGFTNAVRHAHQNISPEITITVEAFLRRDSMEIRIWDYGSAFDLQSFITETARQHGDWLSSGRGIPLLNKIASYLDYQRTEKQQNCLLIVKNFGNYQHQEIPLS